MKQSILLPLCFSLVSLGASSAADNAFVPDAHAPAPTSIKEGTPWRETQSPLPPWPGDADLLEFKLESPASDPFRYFIDKTHLTTGSDGVVRYTLVAEGNSGTRNLSVEGIRCTPRGEYKVYAYGGAGKFTAIDGGAWQPIASPMADVYRKELWQYHLCIPREFKPRPKKDMIRSLQGHIAPRQNTGFQAD
jgi:hypothetical protein